METTIRINTDMLNLDIIEGIKKMFPGKAVEITIQEDVKEDWEEVEIDRNSPHYTEGDEDATQFILNRPSLAAELQRRIDSYEKNKEDLIAIKVEDLYK
ncbi:MAG: hypothetical protein ACR2KZ_20225 [Segetibacter sp.]